MIDKSNNPDEVKVYCKFHKYERVWMRLRNESDVVNTMDECIKAYQKDYPDCKCNVEIVASMHNVTLRSIDGEV